MTSYEIKERTLLHTALTDAALLATACLIPSVSHLLTWSVYKLNPMLMVLAAGMLLTADKWNSYLLAVAVPFTTCLVAGMPSPLGALCMVFEYATVVAMFGFLSQHHKAKTSPAVFAMFIGAVLAGKVVYYISKLLILHPAQLVSTSIVWQLVSMAAIAAVFATLWHKTGR